MAEDASEKKSLSEKFKQVNHWRHTLMDISMIGMAIGGLVATGGAIGFFDPIIGFLKMHVAGIPDLFSSGSEFLSNAWAQAQNGTYFTGAEADMHAMHGGHGLTGEAASSFSGWKGTMGAEEWTETVNKAQSYGMSPEQYYQNLPEAHR